MNVQIFVYERSTKKKKKILERRKKIAAIDKNGVCLKGSDLINDKNSISIQQEIRGHTNKVSEHQMPIISDCDFSA